MADYKVDIRDVKFILNEHLGMEKLCSLSRFKELDFDPESLNDMVNVALKFAQEKLAPINKEGDEVGALRTAVDAPALRMKFRLV